MKKLLLTFLLLSVFTTLGLGQQNGKRYVKVESENFRISPGGDVIGKLNSGTELNVIKEEGNWVKVKVEGYIWKPSITSDSTDVVGFKLHAMHILLKTEAEAQKVLQELKNGADFNELAVKYSIDPSANRNKGDLGVFEKGDLLKEFEDAILKLKPGETSGVVKTPLGYHIIRRVK